MNDLLFIWIPKTAGTSVFTALQEQRGMDLYLDNYRDFPNMGNASFGHLSPLELLKEGVISQDYWQNADKFAIVRNPYDRFVSLWADMKRSNRILPDTTLKDFAFACTQMENRPGLYNTMHYSQCAPQVSWLLPGVDILRFENMPDCLEDIGLQSIQHLNDGKNMGHLWDREEQKIVFDLYREDFSILGYPDMML